MNYRFLAIIIVLIMLISGAVAYSGFNREYYTNYYKPNYYYTTPYESYTYTYSYPTNYAYTGYYNSYYTNSYYTSTYPRYAYNYSYYPTYSTYVVPTYPTRNISIYSNDSGWGISYGTSNICTIYGYC